MMEELPKLAGSTKAAGAGAFCTDNAYSSVLLRIRSDTRFSAAGSARRDVQDTVRVCGQQLLADLAMPFSLGMGNAIGSSGERWKMSGKDGERER